MTKQAKTNFELAVIEKIRELRTQKGLSQYAISVILGTSSSFIGQVEAPNNPSKYNLNHLNRLAFEFGCSPQDFLPDSAIPEKEWSNSH